MPSALFEPITLRETTYSNRIFIAPMCQYSATDGVASDWHMAHIGSLATSGAGLLIMEATAVEPEGRISPHCLGLYSDACEAALERVVTMARSVSPIKLGIQIGHAGRKASTRRPWDGRKPIPPNEDGGWQTVGPSALPQDDGWPVPQALDRAGMDRIRDAHVAAAKRAARLGFDHLEVHCAHGYLLSSFLSPLANAREDDYGGDLEARMRFPLEVVEAVRNVWPQSRSLSVKTNGTDWVDGGWTADDTVVYAERLKALGVDLVVISGGGVSNAARIPTGPGYQVPYAEAVKTRTGMVTGAVGLITDPHQADRVIAEGKADVVCLARGMLFNPRWPQHAAIVLGETPDYLPQYERASPAKWSGYAHCLPLTGGGGDRQDG